MNPEAEEVEKMELEKLIFGRYLMVGTGESQAFWLSLRPRVRLRWLRRFIHWLEWQ